MEAMGSSALSHNMSYVVVHAVFYLVVGARRIQLLSEMETSHAGCKSREARLKGQVFELGSDMQGVEQK